MVMRIKVLRKSKGITQKQLAADVGVGPTVVCNWETEVSLPMSRDLPLVAKVLGCTVDELYDPAFMEAVKAC